MDEKERKEKLDNDKLVQEIEKLKVERTRLVDESEKFKAETARLKSEEDKLQAEAGRLKEEEKKLEAEKLRLQVDTANLTKWARFEWAKTIAGAASLVAALAAIVGLYLSNTSLTTTQQAQTVQQQNQLLADLTKQLASDKRSERTSAASRLGNLLSTRTGAKGTDLAISEPVILNILVWALVVEEDPLVRSAVVGSIQRSDLDINATLNEAIKLTAEDITPLFSGAGDVPETLKTGSPVDPEIRDRWERINQRQKSMLALAKLRFDRQPKDSATKGIDLTGLPLKGFSFVNTSIDLRNADFTNASLLQTDFFKVNLTGANFSGADLTSAKFKFAVLENVNFSGAQIYLAYAGRTFPPANFASATIRGARFEGSCLEGADFSATPIDSIAQFEGASILHTIFSDQQERELDAHNVDRNDLNCKNRKG